MKPNLNRSYFPQPDCITVFLITILVWVTIWAFFGWKGVGISAVFFLASIFILGREKKKS